MKQTKKKKQKIIETLKCKGENTAPGHTGVTKSYRSTADGRAGSACEMWVTGAKCPTCRERRPQRNGLAMKEEAGSITL